MLRIMANGYSGLVAQGLKLDLVAHNLANLNTPGFKERRVNFADLAYQPLPRGGWPVVPNNPPSQQGSGVGVAEVTPLLTQGGFWNTGRKYDLAVAGEGFLGVELATGELAFTRAGNFGVDAQGQVLDGAGRRLYPPLVLPEGWQDFLVQPEGRVLVREAGGEWSEAGWFYLYRFANPEGLEAAGENLWLATEASGAPQSGWPGLNGFGRLVQGVLESSNVDLATQVTEMILAQRAYQLNARSVQVADEMWSLANDLRR